MAVAVAGLAIGAGLWGTRPSQYSATTSVLVQPVPAGPVSGGSAPLGTDAVNLDTEAQLVRSTDTATRAAALLGTTVPPAQLADAVTVQPVAGSSVLVLRFEADSADAAQAGARAFAQAYLAARAALAQSVLTDRRDILNASLTDATTQLADLDARIAHLPDDSSQLPSLRSTRSGVADQISTLTGRISDLAATVVSPGQVIQDAARPIAPESSLAWLFLVAGPLAGVALGLASALTWEYLRPHVRDGDDIVDRAGVTLLAELDSADAELHAPSDPVGREYHRLRNVVTAALTPRDRVVLITGASPGPGSTIVAANLAAALARVGHEVVLLGANPPAFGASTILLSQLFDISDIPGLTDVLSGRTELGFALQVPPREPRLRVVAPGGTASASRLLQSAAAQSTVHSLRTLARFVLIDSPSAAVGADAQSLSGLADAAIVVAETGHARHAEVVDAAAQLRLVGTRVLGAVVLPRAVTSTESLVDGTARWTRLQVQPDGRVVHTPLDDEPEEPAVERAERVKR